MTAWAKLLACSQLLAGTAWQLISNPKTGGTGVVVNDGIAVELSLDAALAEVADMQIEVELPTPEVVVEVAPPTVAVEVAATPIEVEIAQ